MDPIIKLDIGGYRYVTSKSTLFSKGENLFYGLLGGRLESNISEDGYIFIDRNGRYFEPILDYLRTGISTTNCHEFIPIGETKVAGGLDIGLVQKEAEFFLVEEMRIYCENIKPLNNEKRLSTESEAFQAEGLCDFSIIFISSIFPLDMSYF